VQVDLKALKAYIDQQLEIKEFKLTAGKALEIDRTSPNSPIIAYNN
jgi:hypothetical protein